MQDKRNLSSPRVSIGIPTYNRAGLLKRSIESALNQDYPNIEVLISDNASTDETMDICRFYCDKLGSLVKYFRQSANCGATANFSKVLQMASGEFFMWLGDDDWLDISYVRFCVNDLLSDSSLTLVSGVPRYYRNDSPVFVGKQFNILNESWLLRVIIYYAKVADNGMFYGLMRTAQIQQINILNTMGGDWHVIAALSSMGKIKFITEIQVHRELGGATASYHQIVRSLGLSRMQAIFPMTSVAASAWVDIAIKGAAYHSRSALERLMLASMVFGVILLKRFLGFCKSGAKFIIKKLN
jgi:glycosyltransferase involved in cell wall biosynthesis